MGLVVRKDNLQAVVGAKVYGVPRSFRGNDWEAESGVDGKFKVKHNAQPTYAYATNADKSLVGVAEIPDTRLAIVVQLEPAGSARGRLINDAKEPVAGHRIDYGIDVPDEENRTWSTRFTGYKELMKPIRDGAEGGSPWFAIIDANGQKLATPNDLKTGENIGFPSEESGQIHFANMLNTNRQRMTEQEVESMIKSATDIGK